MKLTSFFPPMKVLCFSLITSIGSLCAETSVLDLMKDKAAIEKFLTSGDANLWEKRQRAVKLMEELSAAGARHPELARENAAVDAASQVYIAAVSTSASALKEASIELEKATAAQEAKLKTIPELEKLRREVLKACATYRKDLDAAVAADVDGARVLKELKSRGLENK
jgi:hypothetical protein